MLLFGREAVMGSLFYKIRMIKKLLSSTSLWIKNAKKEFILLNMGCTKFVIVFRLRYGEGLWGLRNTAKHTFKGKQTRVECDKPYLFWSFSALLILLSLDGNQRLTLVHCQRIFGWEVLKFGWQWVTKIPWLLLSGLALNCKEYKRVLQGFLKKT